MRTAKEIARTVCPHSLRECEAWREGGHLCKTLHAIAEYGDQYVVALVRASRALDYAQSAVENENNRKHVLTEYEAACDVLRQYKEGTP